VFSAWRLTLHRDGIYIRPGLLPPKNKPLTYFWYCQVATTAWSSRFKVHRITPFTFRIQFSEPYIKTGITQTSTTDPTEDSSPRIDTNAANREETTPCLFNVLLDSSTCYCCTGFCSIFATLAEINKAKSIVLIWKSKFAPMHWECGYVICTNYVPEWAVCCKDSAKPCMHLYLNCIRNKNSTQNLETSICVDVVKNLCLPSKALWRHGMCCSAASLQLSVHFKY